MRVGLIEHAEPIEKSDKLMKLQVDFGPLGKRQILSGVRKYLAVEDLQGKKGIFVTNFAPRMMMGHESQGTMLTAESDVKLSIYNRVLILLQVQKLNNSFFGIILLKVFLCRNQYFLVFCFFCF